MCIFRTYTYAYLEPEGKKFCLRNLDFDVWTLDFSCRTIIFLTFFGQVLQFLVAVIYSKVFSRVFLEMLAVKELALIEPEF